MTGSEIFQTLERLLFFLAFDVFLLGTIAINFSPGKLFTKVILIVFVRR
jgi:hypothetical protein